MLRVLPLSLFWVKIKVLDIGKFYQGKMKYRQSLFWDTKPENIDKEKHKRYIIERVLEFGRDREVRDVVHEFSVKEIRKVVNLPRSLTPKTKNLWIHILKK